MNYGEKKVFDQNEANRFIDLLYYQIENYITENTTEGISLDSQIALSGTAAAKMQGASITQFKQIVIVVSNVTLFKIIDKIIELVPAEGVIRFKEKY